MRRNGLLTIFIAAIFFLSSPIYAATPVNNGPKISDADVHIAFSLPDTCVDDDWVGLPPGTNVTFPGDPDPHTIGTDAFPTINAAFAATSANATIYVAPGAYSESLTITKAIRIIGSGKGTDPTQDTVITSLVSHAFILQSGNVTIENLSITTNNRPTNGNAIHSAMATSNLTFRNLYIYRCSYGMFFDYTASTANVVVVDCDMINNINTGIYFFKNDALRQSVACNNFLVERCNFINMGYGFYVCTPHLPPPPMRINDFTNLTIRNCVYQNLSYKAMYFEKLSNAIFDSLTITNTGYWPGYGSPFGIDINLKYGDFTNILFNNCVFTRCGNTHAINGMALGIKGRSDNAYSANPATLTGVTILGCVIQDSIRGICIDNSVYNVSIIDTIVRNCSYGLNAIGTVGLVVRRCAFLSNMIAYPPYSSYANTYGIGISGRRYPNSTTGPLWQPTDAVIESCIFCGNTNAALVNIDEVLNVAQYGYESSKIDARRNWWGSNSGPSGFGPGNGDPIGPSGIKYRPWIVMRIRALSSSIVVGGYSTPVMVDFHSDLDGGTVSPDILDGILTVELSTNLGLINGGTSTILLINGGGASATLTSGEIIGIADLRAVSIQSPSGEPAQGEVQIVGEVNLQLRKWVKKSTCNVDEKAVFYISVSNAGTVDAINVVLYDNFPNELVYDTSRPTGAQGINGVKFEIGRLKVGETRTFEIAFKLNKNIQFPGNSLTVINNTSCTATNSYTGKITGAKASASMLYVKAIPSPDFTITAKWNGLDTKASTIESGKELELGVKVEGGQFPCDVTVDWGDGKDDMNTLDGSTETSFKHSWTSGEYVVTITATDAYARTKTITRKITVK